MRSLAPVYELPGVQRVSLAQLIAAPREVFRELRPDTSLRPFLYVLMIAVPVLPVLMAIVSTDALREGFLSSSETASIAQHAPVVAFAFSIAMLCAQGVGLAAHLLGWMVLSKIFGSSAPSSLVIKAWCYAIIPLILRQVFLMVVSVIMGSEWLAGRSWLLQVFDPFLVWAAVCFYIAARSTLHLGKVRAVVLALFCSFIGAVSPLLEHVIRSL